MAQAAAKMQALEAPDDYAVSCSRSIAELAAAQRQFVCPEQLTAFCNSCSRALTPSIFFLGHCTHVVHINATRHLHSCTDSHTKVSKYYLNISKKKVKCIV